MSDNASNPEVKVEPVVITEPATKLRDFLGKIATDPDRSYDDASIALGKALAEYVNDDQIIPAGYVMATTLFTVDCARNMNGYTGNPMPTEITGYPSFMYRLFQLTAMDMARDAYGDEFADQAQAYYEGVSQV